MKILALDTSTRILALGIFDNAKLIVEGNSDSNARHGEGIVPAVRRILSCAKTDLNEIGGFIVGIGPGSFTGLRVGVSLIKSFCFTKKRPVLAIPSLDLIAYNGILYRMNICVLVDAKQNKVYTCLYNAIGKQKLRRISKYLLCPIEEVLDLVKKKFRDEVLFVGDGINLYRDIILREVENALFAKEDFWYPKARNLGALGWPQFKAKATKNLDKLNPLYLYPKECQIRQNEK